jgi:hypothetical protein
MWSSYSFARPLRAAVESFPPSKAFPLMFLIMVRRSMKFKGVSYQMTSAIHPGLYGHFQSQMLSYPMNPARTSRSRFIALQQKNRASRNCNEPDEFTQAAQSVRE